MRFMILEGDIYDLNDGSLRCEPIGEWNGKKIYPAEALLEKLEGLISPIVIFPLEHDGPLLKYARWFD